MPLQILLINEPFPILHKYGTVSYCFRSLITKNSARNYELESTSKESTFFKKIVLPQGSYCILIGYVLLPKTILFSLQNLELF